MSDILAKICDDKRAHIARQQAIHAPASVMAAAQERNRSDPPRGFAKRLERAVRAGFPDSAAMHKKCLQSSSTVLY